MSKPESSEETTPPKTDLVVIDRFYGTNKDRLEGIINPEKHNVIASARSMGEAALILSQLASGELNTPDAIILGGTLGAEPEHMDDPHTITQQVQESREKRKGLFGPKQEFTEERTVESYILPVKNADGSYSLPEKPPRRPAAELDKAKQEFQEQLSPQDKASLGGYAIAGALRSMSQTESIPIIGTSADFNSPESTAPIDDTFIRSELAEEPAGPEDFQATLDKHLTKNG